MEKIYTWRGDINKHMEKSCIQGKIHMEGTYTPEKIYIPRGRTHEGTVPSIQHT